MTEGSCARRPPRPQQDRPRRRRAETKIRSWLDDHFSRYRLVEAERGNVPLEILLSAGRFDPTRLEFALVDDDECVHEGQRFHHGRYDHCHDHDRDFSTMSFESDRPLSLAALRDVAARLPADIYRCKGVIHTVDSCNGAQ